VLRIVAGLLIAAILAVMAPAPPTTHAEPTAGTLLASGLKGTIGSTIGPDGALYAGEGPLGRISRVDLETGAITTFASGLPKTVPAAGIGGVMDVAFYGHTAYALLTLVGPDAGGSDVVGIYRIDGPDSFTVIADLGQFSMDNPPVPAFFVPSGVPFALEAYRDGFLVTDGHHNRVLYVTLDGEITELITFDNIVPTGLRISGTTIYMAQAGPVPHAPEDGKVVRFRADSSSSTQLAAGASLVIDVERGRGGTIYALSQGPSVPGTPEGSPGAPDSGKLLEVNGTGGFSVLVEALDLPSSLEIVRDTAYILTLNGEVWKVEDLSGLSPIASPAPAITPPSTGDGGLADGRDSLMTLSMLTLATLGGLAVTLRRTRRDQASRTWSISVKKPSDIAG
jgi:hypothetical protein